MKHEDRFDEDRFDEDRDLRGMSQIYLGGKMTTIFNLKAAMRSTIEKKDKKFICKICGHISDKIYRAIKHTKIHVKSEIKSVSHSCTMCHKMFSTLSRLEKHKLNRHQAEKTEETQIIITNKDDEQNYIKEKLKTMVQKVNGMWSCKICGRAGRDQFNCMLHAETHMKGVFRKCNGCDKLFSTLSSLQSHIIVVHNVKRTGPNSSYKCDRCDYIASKSCLKIHKESVHEGIKHECTYCKMKLSNRGNLLKHLKIVHPILVKNEK